jgi:cytochrome c oxidase assembly protein Cox11
MRKVISTIFVMIAIFVVGMTTAIAVAPIYECPCGQYGYKIDDWNQEDDGINMDGTYYDPASGNTITISNSDDEGYVFDWESEYPVCAVVVKGGNGNVTYTYNGAYSDSELVAPLNENSPCPDDTRQISHVTFCFCDPDNEIPEFPMIALPIAAIIGLAFIFQRRKE